MVPLGHRVSSQVRNAKKDISRPGTVSKNQSPLRSKRLTSFRAPASAGDQLRVEPTEVLASSFRETPSVVRNFKSVTSGIRG